MIDQITNINAKIESLRKQKAKIQTQQAICFVRETQKILRDDFTPEVALNILTETWRSASESQKQNWRREGDFQPSVVKQGFSAPNLPTTKDELIRAYEELCEEFLAAMGKNKLY